MRESLVPAMNSAGLECPATSSVDYLLQAMTYLAKILRYHIMKCFPDYICNRVFVARVNPSDLSVMPLSRQGMKDQDVYTVISPCLLHDLQIPVSDREFHIVEGRFGIIAFKMIRINPNEYLVGYEMARKPVIHDG